jgi:hypothetical protein
MWFIINGNGTQPGPWDWRLQVGARLLLVLPDGAASSLLLHQCLSLMGSESIPRWISRATNASLEMRSMWEAFRSPKRGRAKGSGCVCSDTIQNGCKTNLQVLYSDSALKYSDKSCGHSERRKFRELARSWTLHSCVWRLRSVASLYIRGAAAKLASRSR